MNGSRARIALVALNLGLFGAIVYLGQHGLRRATQADVPGPLPVEYALPAEEPTAGDSSREIGAQLDPPPPPGDLPPPVEPRPVLATKYRLLLVSEDRADPARSTAIVATAGGDQRTVAVGDQLDDFEVVHLGVHGVGDERRATLVAEREGERVELQTERGARP